RAGVVDHGFLASVESERNRVGRLVGDLGSIAVTQGEKVHRTEFVEQVAHRGRGNLRAALARLRDAGAAAIEDVAVARDLYRVARARTQAYVALQPDAQRR